MPIQFAGVDLLLEDPDGAVQSWLDHYLDQQDSRPFSEKPSIFNTNLMQSQSGQRAFRGLPMPNYSAPPRFRINTLWWPTGAARWAVMYGLTDDAGLTSIKSQISTTGSPNTAGTLAISDSSSGISPKMYLLPPRPISEIGATERLWLLPFVDVRYFWQFAVTDASWDVSSLTWATLLDAISGQLVGFGTLSHDTIVSQYLSPDPGELNRTGFPHNLYLDAVLASVAQRLVSDPTAEAVTIKGQNWASAKTALTANLAISGLQNVAGGDFTDQVPAPIIPYSVDVHFPKYANHHWYTDGSLSTYNRPLSEVGGSLSSSVHAGTGTKKIIRSTCYADYTGGSLQNDTQLSDLATQIATDYYLSLLYRYDRTFAGIVPWKSCGYDDWTEWSYCRLPNGDYKAQTRVHSLPYNMGVEEQLSQADGLTVIESPVRGKTAADVNSGNSATLSVYAGTFGGETATGETIDNVRNDTESIITGLTIVTAIWVPDNSRWEFLSVDSAGSEVEYLYGTAQDNYFNTDLPSFTVGSDTVVAAADYSGMIAVGGTYHLLRFGSDYFVLNPTRTLVGKSDGNYVAGDIGTFSVYYGPTTDAGFNLDADVRVNSSIASGDWVILEFIDGIWGDFGTDKGRWTVFEGGSGGVTVPSITAVADAFYVPGDTAMFGSGTYSAGVPFGVVLSGLTYELAWVDGAWLVQDPEISLIGKPTAITPNGNAATVTVYHGSTGSETSVSETVDAWVRDGLVFAGQWVHLLWVDQDWEIIDPTLEVDGISDAAIADGDPGDVSVYAESSIGDATDSGVNITAVTLFGDVGDAKRVRCAWCKDSRAWEIVNAHC